jgi:hypothetical protein
MIKNVKLKILICFNSPNIEPFYTKHFISSPFLYRIGQFLCCWTLPGGGLEIFFQL